MARTYLMDDACDALSRQDIRDLARAVRLLEENNFVARVSSLVGDRLGRGYDWIMDHLPPDIRDTIAEIAQEAAGKAIDYAYRSALLTIDTEGGGLTGWDWLDRQLSSEWFDKAAATLAGVAGGAAGSAGTAVELPVTTAIIMRSVAQIARDEGEELGSDEAKAECLNVFAFGGASSDDDEADTGYYAVRFAIAGAIGRAAGKTLEEILPKLLAQILPRFNINVTWKFAGQAVPVVGAATGGIINFAFMDHYQDKARGHFTVRRLERKHGANQVRACYERLKHDWLAEKASAKKNKRKKAPA